jgi:hypothetical protein
MDIPMLEDHEWDIVAPHLSNAIEQLKQYRLAHGVALSEAGVNGNGKRHYGCMKN